MLHQVKIATAVAALLAGTAVVAAQPTQREAPSGTPGTQSPTPGQQKGEPKAAPKAAEPKAEPKAAPKAAEPKAEPKAAPKAAEPKAEPKAAPKAAEPKAEPKAAPKAAEPKAEPKAAPKAAEPGAGAPGTTTTVTTEQRTQIRQTIISESNAPRVTNVNFSLNVGTVVPRTVRTVVLPPRVVEIYPAWRGYYYFLVGDRIVIVDPDTLRIVFIIDV
jgi:outer membrane biosynthesis protein TonB